MGDAAVTELDQTTVRRRLAVIARHLALLEPEIGIPLTEYRADLLRRAAIERLLQVALEATLDVCKHVLRVRGVPRPTSAHGLIIAAGAVGLVPTELAASLADAAGLRNRLVHEYDDLDDAKVHESIADAVRLLPQFAAAVERYLDDPAR